MKKVFQISVDKPLVSIIVPVYNAEHFLETCIESIIAQTYKHIEVIFVNDGSTDRSKRIIERYINVHPFRLINQENKGAASARNRGLEAAKGSYIQFVDADDLIKHDAIEKHVQKMEHADLVISGYETIHETYMPTVAGLYDKADFLTHFGELFQKIIILSPCNKMYRKDIIETNGIKFCEEMVLGEDLLFNLAYLAHCKSIYLLQEPLYFYRTNKNSLTHSYQNDLFERQKVLFQAVRKFLRKENALTNKNRQQIETIYANALLHAATNLFHKQNPYTVKQRFQKLITIMNDEETKNQLPYFTDSKQAKLFSRLIEQERHLSAFIFFQIKEFLRSHFHPIFQFLRKLN